MKRVIKIKSTEFARKIKENKEKIGSPDWDIFVNIESGKIDVRHNTYPTNDWHEICDLYSFWDDSETLSSPINSLAAWLKTDAIPFFEDYFNDETGKKIEIKWL